MNKLFKKMYGDKYLNKLYYYLLIKMKLVSRI